MARLFVGVELDDSARAAAADLAARFRRDLTAAGVHLDARWVPAENLHVTLWFIGEVRDERAREIAAALAPPIPVPAFDMELERVGAFPPSRPPRVLWIGVGEGASQVASLYDHVGTRLAPLGFAPERRAFSAHLTIARVKDVPRRDDVRVLGHVMDDFGRAAGLSRVTCVTLFRSRLSPKGAAYEPLLRVPLG